VAANLKVCIGFLAVSFSWYAIVCKSFSISDFHNITAKAVLKFGSDVWVLKKREEQRLEAAQMKFLRHLLGITKKEIYSNNM
jgi:hypothetical protein